MNTRLLDEVKIGAFDIETYVNSQGYLIPYCICFEHSKLFMTYYGKRCVEDFIDFILDYKEDMVLFAHNLTFDGKYVISELNSRGVKVDVLMLKCSIYYINFTNNHNFIIKIKCSYKFIPLSLKKISKFLDVPEKGELDHKMINYSNYLNEEIKTKVVEYCKRDVSIVIRVIYILKSSLEVFNYDWLKNCSSISSISLNLFKKFYNTVKIPLRLSLALDNIYRRVYVGSRVEKFGNLKKAIEFLLHFDYSGMYNGIMLEKFPLSSRAKYISRPKDINKFGIYYIRFFSDIPSIPFLHYREEETKKLLFPNGDIEG